MKSSFYVVNFSHNFRQWRLNYYVSWMIESIFWITQSRETLRLIFGSLLSRRFLIRQWIFYVILNFFQSRFLSFQIICEILFTNKGRLRESFSACQERNLICFVLEGDAIFSRLKYYLTFWKPEQNWYFQRIFHIDYEIATNSI